MSYIRYMCLGVGGHVFTKDFLYIVNTLKNLYVVIMFKVPSRVLLSEFLGTTFLLIGVIGSGIMAENLSPSDEGLQLLQNAFATAGVLIAIISIFGSISADFNPVVTISAWLLGHRKSHEVLPILLIQIAGGCFGTVLANVMFDLDWFQVSEKTRTGGNLWVAEVIATVGLLLVIFSLLRTDRLNQIPYVVGVYIGGAYYFTSSTSFANPAVSIGRMLSNSFAGIQPSSVPMFILMQLIGMGVGILVIHFLFPRTRENQRQ
jgi:glycerol uptake facilitator-like aquaporin